MKREKKKLIFLFFFLKNLQVKTFTWNNQILKDLDEFIKDLDMDLEETNDEVEAYL